jgi:hypothetical protein
MMKAIYQAGLLKPFKSMQSQPVLVYNAAEEKMGTITKEFKIAAYSSVFIQNICFIQRTKIHD